MLHTRVPAGLLLILLLSGSQVAGVSAQTGAAARAVIHFNMADPIVQQKALDNVVNARNELGRASEIEVVVHGDAIGLVARGQSAYADKVAELISAGVRVVACENTMRKKGLGREQLLPGVGTVPSGVAELVRRQQEGFAYVRP